MLALRSACTLSPTLQGQIVLHINSRWLNRVWFFQGAEHEFMTQGISAPIGASRPSRPAGQSFVSQSMVKHV